ncbi:ABC transporter permease [Lutispora thermophila]|uniref:Peptide/nickel transport system permease protein n=1 Tax=Lutispora thermophila DSM 19022 TaxID=1122184 RepID=A0A1M6BBE4_9FIRM|nr:ABC transporter permease [Lutispora thermophila]SHI45987.1 peptide/nickel transport system permease protein [Lutispora thermophila DSM 19022]
MKSLNHRTKVVILTAVMFVLLVAVYACGILISEEAVTGSFLNAKRPPCLEHPFGTDALGRDLFLRTLKGLSVSITVGLVASLISAVIAVLVGIAAANGSKWVDALINWIIDLVMSVPHTILIILISFALGRGLKGLLMGIAATHWCSLARLIRGEVLQLRSQQYVAVSRKLGKSSGWILTNHLLPHLVPQFFVGLILMFPHAILHEASISFLGFGLPPEQPAIGIILSESMRYLSTGMWWIAVLPGLTLVLIVLLIDKFGDHLRMILDPYSAQE